MMNNALNAYKSSAINTASKAELTLMLYEGAIKFCNIGMIAMEKNEVVKVNTNLLKAQRIIAEFRVTLDARYPVAKDFDLVYDYIYQRLMDANLHMDKEALEESLGYIREMRDTWKEVMRLNKVGSKNI